ncbi:MAG: urease accessory protein UreD [Pseudomonadota bacterium]
MLDQTQPIRRQRVQARAAVSFRTDGTVTRLDNLAQQGSAKAMLPRCHRPDPEVVFLNTAGGLTGGDQMSFAVDLAEGSKAVATTQTAERAYASLPETGPAKMSVQLNLAAGAHLDWLPQETILFDRSALHRETHVNLKGDASLLWCEMVVLGRAAMGEVVKTLDFHDLRRVTRDGRPILIEPLRLTTETLEDQSNPAVLGGATAFATVGYFGSDADRLLSDALAHADGFAAGQASASAWDNKLVVRAKADKAWPLRQWLHRLLTDLRRGPLPRVWTL